MGAQSSPPRTFPGNALPLAGSGWSPSFHLGCAAVGSGEEVVVGTGTALVLSAPSGQPCLRRPVWEDCGLREES